MTTKYEFDTGFQNKILGHILRDTSYMEICNNIVLPEYFEEIESQWLSKYAVEYFKKFNQVPSIDIIRNDLKALKTSGRIKPEVLTIVVEKIKLVFNPAFDLSNREYMIEVTAKFAKKKAMEEAILRAADFIDKDLDFDAAVAEIEKARQVGATDMGVVVDYWDEVDKRIESRIEKMRTKSTNGITTGYKELDDELYNSGWGRKELSVLMGAAKSGKSIGLGQFSLNASKAGYNVAHISLENSADIVGDRMDANVSDTIMKDVTSKSIEVKESVERHAEKAGKLFIHEFASENFSPADLNRLINYYASKGIILDLITVDYADLMRPDFRTTDEIANSKSIYTGLRAVAQKHNLAVLTATQTNRSGAKAHVAKPTDVAEDFNRVRIADVFIIIAATEKEQAEDKFRLYFGAMRNSASGIVFNCCNDKKRMKFITRFEKGII